MGSWLGRSLCHSHWNFKMQITLAYKIGSIVYVNSKYIHFWNMTNPNNCSAITKTKQKKTRCNCYVKLHVYRFAPCNRVASFKFTSFIIFFINLAFALYIILTMFIRKRFKIVIYIYTFMYLSPYEK